MKVVPIKSPMKKALSIVVLMCISLSVIGIADYSHFCSMAPATMSCSGCETTSGCCDTIPAEAQDNPCCTTEIKMIQADLSPVTFHMNTNRIIIHHAELDPVSTFSLDRRIHDPANETTVVSYRESHFHRSLPDLTITNCTYLI